MLFFLRKLYIFALAVLPLSTHAVVSAQVAAVNKEEVERHLSIYDEVTEQLDDIFSEFSLGNIEADPALKKTSLLSHEYTKLIRPVPPETKHLHELTLQLLSRIENYFISFKRWNREDPALNLKIAETRYELHKELIRIQYEYQ